MSYNIDFSIATSDQIEAALCKRMESIRLSQGVSMDTFIRVMIALRIQHNLEALLPDPTVRPIERIGLDAGERKRARPAKTINKLPTWSWGDEEEDNE